MEIQIENLRAKMRGEKLNHYQEGLALDEFEKLIAHAEALTEQLRQYNVSGRSEQLCRTFLSDGTTSSATKCRFCGKEKWRH